MGRGGETDDQQTSRRIAEPRDGPPPVVFPPKRRAFLDGDTLAPFHETGAGPAIAHRSVDGRNRRERSDSLGAPVASNRGHVVGEAESDSVASGMSTPSFAAESTIDVLVPSIPGRPSIRLISMFISLSSRKRPIARMSKSPVIS